MPSDWLEILKMIDWIPVVFVVFKVLMFGTGMFFAIKWHYDQDKKDKRAVLRTAGIVMGVLVLLFLLLGGLIFVMVRMFGLDLSLP